MTVFMQVCCHVNLHRMTTGTRDMRIDKRTEGSRPEMKPMTTWTQDVSTEYAWDGKVTDIRNLLEPSKGPKCFEKSYVADGTNGSYRDGPEQNESTNERVDSVSSDDPLPPRNRKGLPDNLVRADADISGGHVESAVVCEHLSSTLGFSLGTELDKDAASSVARLGAV